MKKLQRHSLNNNTPQQSCLITCANGTIEHVPNIKIKKKQQK